MKPELDQPMPLDIALRKFFPDGGLSKDAMLAAIRRGDLNCERIGRAYFVTAADVKEWRSRCRVRGYQPGSGSGNAKAGNPDGSLSMDERKSTLAAAKATVSALKKNLGNTSRKRGRSTPALATPLRLVSQT